MATTWTFPNAIMQYALPALEQQSLDVAQLQRRRDFMVDALLTMGYHVSRPQGTFYLFPRTPIPDDVAFTRQLAEQGILALPGTVFETPGFFRLCLTATDDECERALAGFARAMDGG
jgi:aspartate aminotransferase